MPLQTIINPSLVNDLLWSLTTMAEESGNGYYERWEFLNAYSGCMLGNPAIAVLADAYAKDICQLNMDKAYAYADKTSKMFGNSALGYSLNPSSISKTLEYAYTEWCMSRLAEAMGKHEDAEYYAKLSQSYRNLYDTEKHCFRPREADGSFEAWPAKGILQEGYGCTECNEYQQRWFVPHDIQGMVELMGGIEQVVADLDTLFAKLRLISYGMHITIMQMSLCTISLIYITVWENPGKLRNVHVSSAIMLTITVWKAWSVTKM